MPPSFLIFLILVTIVCLRAAQRLSDSAGLAARLLGRMLRRTGNVAAASALLVVFMGRRAHRRLATRQSSVPTTVLH